MPGLSSASRPREEAMWRRTEAPWPTRCQLPDVWVRLH